MLMEIFFGAVITFIGMFLAAKITNFYIHNGQLAIVSGVVTGVGFIPGIGFIASLISAFALLKLFSDSKGILLMVIVSWVMSILALMVFSKII